MMYGVDLILKGGNYGKMKSNYVVESESSDLALRKLLDHLRNEYGPRSRLVKLLTAAMVSKEQRPRGFKTAYVNVELIEPGVVDITWSD